MSVVEKMLESIVKLAVMTCASDGEILPNENSLVQEWIDQRHEKYSAGLEKALRDARQQLKSQRGISVKQVCRDLAGEAPVSVKYEAMELCLRIAQVDGVGADEEMRFLMSVGKWLDLDYGKFREMRDKILPVSIHETNDIKTLLGLYEDMTPSEVRKHLLKEYQRWNHLTTHQDSKKREQAREMLEIIAKKRSEVRNG